MRVLLAEPRGFCAGVDRAIAIVEKALEKFGPPIYVRHEIVHNRWVVESLRRKGAKFVQELSDVPDGETVIYSAHGVSKAVEAEGERRPLQVLDATCPLVSKVHREAERLDRDGRRIFLIGHKGHPEVEGTVGQLGEGQIEVISQVYEVESMDVGNGEDTAFITQTTLSVDETADVVGALRKKFPGIQEPGREDICYATQNRQNAVKALVKECDLILVIGAPNSSNSNRLQEVAERGGVKAHLIESADDINFSWLDGVRCLGVTAGASAPEILVNELLESLSDRVKQVDVLSVSEENLVFPLPAVLQ
ncbi:MAG: 4-hydroxy-3-methylbut-2-enyl diphosphate reductase [Magnetococcales bacterium]|nr:4-hydroxy-3-methylbut-2-enyl diphosphate reductase [Magnetococcales bacterium]